MQIRHPAVLLCWSIDCYRGAKMNNKITLYYQNYVQNFREHPAKAAAELVLQILFLIGWGCFFYMVYKDFTNIVIPGKTDPKSNIYWDCAEIIVYTVVYIYIFFRLLPMMFAGGKGLRQRAYAFLISAGAAFLISAFSLEPFIPENWHEVEFTAFWAE